MQGGGVQEWYLWYVFEGSPQALLCRVCVCHDEYLWGSQRHAKKLNILLRKMRQQWL